MRRCFVFVLLAVSAVVWTAGAIPLCDYRSPKTDLSDLTLGFSYQYHNDPYGLDTRDVNQGQFSVDYVQLFDTPQYGFDLAFENTLMVSAEGLSTYGLTADGNYKRYISTEQDFFAYSGAALRSSSSFQKLGLTFSLGLGVGRFTDVTPLAKATRINDYLVSRGSLTDELHPVDLQILALEIGSAASYESQAALLAVIQEIIETSGSVRLGGLDALDISEITRFIQEEGFSRYCGSDLKLGVGYELLDPSGGDNDLLFSGGFDYALATTPKAQFLLQGSFSGPSDIFETHRADFTGSYDYFISNFLSANAAYNWTRETWSGVNTDTNRISLELTLSPVDTANVVVGILLEHRPYYLEWSIDIQLSIQMDLL